MRLINLYSSNTTSIIVNCSIKDSVNSFLNPVRDFFHSVFGKMIIIPEICQLRNGVKSFTDTRFVVAEFILKVNSDTFGAFDKIQTTKKRFLTFPNKLELNKL